MLRRWWQPRLQSGALTMPLALVSSLRLSPPSTCPHLSCAWCTPSLPVSSRDRYERCPPLASTGLPTPSLRGTAACCILFNTLLELRRRGRGLSSACPAPQVPWQNLKRWGAAGCARPGRAAFPAGRKTSSAQGAGRAPSGAGPAESTAAHPEEAGRVGGWVGAHSKCVMGGKSERPPRSICRITRHRLHAHVPKALPATWRAWPCLPVCARPSAARGPSTGRS